MVLQYTGLHFCISIIVSDLTTGPKLFRSSSSVNTNLSCYVCNYPAFAAMAFFFLQSMSEPVLERRVCRNRKLASPWEISCCEVCLDPDQWFSNTWYENTKIPLGLPFQCLCSLLNISLKHKTWLHLSLVKVMYIIMKSRVLDFYFPPNISSAVESIVIQWNENTFCSLCFKQWFIFFPVVVLVKQAIVTPKMNLAYSSDICQNFHLFGLSFYQRSWIFLFSQELTFWHVL